MRKSKEADRDYFQRWRAEHLDQVRATHRRYANSPKGRNWKYLRRYGITVEQYEAMLATQGGVCALCSKPPKKQRLGVDHNHKTKVVRALLCTHCNKTVLGGLRDNPVLVHQLINYLHKHFPIQEVVLS